MCGQSTNAGSRGKMAVRRSVGAYVCVLYGREGRPHALPDTIILLIENYHLRRQGPAPAESAFGMILLCVCKGVPKIFHFGPRPNGRGR